MHHRLALRIAEFGISETKHIHFDARRTSALLCAPLDDLRRGNVLLAELFEHHVRCCIGVAWKVVKLVHRYSWFAFGRGL
jgi:hypothetical protein